jgi:four helix bundle protein
VKESVFAQTKADFTSKLFIAQKECAETEYWLELLYESGYMSNAEFHSIYEDCEELMRLLVSSTKTSQGK